MYHKGLLIFTPKGNHSAIGGTTVGSFCFAGTTPTVQTLNKISHATGSQTVTLALSSDNGTWDADIDYLQWSDR